MGKFKVGDRVRVTDPRLLRTGTPVGAIGTITEIEGRAAYFELEHPECGKIVQMLYDAEEYLELLPATRATGTLTIQPGKFYLTRDGRKVGPARQNWGDADYPWWVGDLTYTDSGAWVDGMEDDNDLVAEAEPQTATEILDELEEWIAKQDAARDNGSTAGFTVPLFDEDDEPIVFEGGQFKVRAARIKPDATLTTKITVDFSDFDAELDRIFGRLRKLKRKARKMGISLDAGGLQDAA